MAKVAAPGQQQQGPLGPIQIIPPGLLGLLQLKQLGRLPDNLADTVAGVLELRDWYLTARRLTEVALFGAAPTLALTQAGGPGCTPFAATVPNSQMWYVEQMHVRVHPTGAQVATDLIRYAPAIIQGLPGGATVAEEIVGPDVADNTLAARTRELRAKADRGFWAFPTDSFAITVFDILSTNGYTAELHLRATACPI